MSGLTLYGISSEMERLLDAIEENGGELTPDLEAALTITEQQFAAKCEDYGKAILHFRAMSDMIGNEIERLSGLKKYYDNTEKRLCGAVSSAMQAFDVPKVENGCMRLSLRRSTATMIDDADAIPDRFKTTKIERVVNKTEIKKAIQAGEDVQGAHLFENVSLQIK